MTPGAENTAMNVPDKVMQARDLSNKQTAKELP
jgi:hypothetical protein